MLTLLGSTARVTMISRVREWLRQKSQQIKNRREEKRREQGFETFFQEFERASQQLYLLRKGFRRHDLTEDVLGTYAPVIEVVDEALKECAPEFRDTMLKRFKRVLVVWW